MAFPSGPSNNQLATVNNITYIYSSASNSWTKTTTSNIAIGGNLVVSGGIQNTPIGNATTSTGAFTTLQASTSFNTGGNATVNALTVNGSATIGTTLGISGNINGTGATFTGNITRGGNNVITNYTGNTAPTSPGPGDEWYYRPSDTLYKYIYDGGTYNWISISSALYAANTGAVANTIALRDSGGNLTATNFLGVASSAKYADLAEIYVPDVTYAPGIVVVFGGSEEITITDRSHDTRVAGVISTNPAYLMNSECEGLPVAFTGRVPCFVKGPVNKGDLLVTSNEPGVAQALTETEYKPGCVFGKSLGQITDTTITTIEVVVGRY